MRVSQSISTGDGEIGEEGRGGEVQRWFCKIVRDEKCFALSLSLSLFPLSFQGLLVIMVEMILRERERGGRGRDDTVGKGRDENERT